MSKYDDENYWRIIFDRTPLSKEELDRNKLDMGQFCDDIVELIVHLVKFIFLVQKDPIFAPLLLVYFNRLKSSRPKKKKQ